MNDYGTPDALTILPYWTNGCIDSMEGLYYEASATTPFHFLDQNELSLQTFQPHGRPALRERAERRPRRRALQMLGVKYYMALNTRSKSRPTPTPRSS